MKLVCFIFLFILSIQSVFAYCYSLDPVEYSRCTQRENYYNQMNQMQQQQMLQQQFMHQQQMYQQEQMMRQQKEYQDKMLRNMRETLYFLTVKANIKVQII